MKSKHIRLLVLASFVMATPAALASTWYVNGVSGSDSNNCMSATTACKSIGHAISLAASGDTVAVAAATYAENLNIKTSLRVLGTGAATTIIDGRGLGRVVTVSAHVILSHVTIRNGFAPDFGGGILNQGTLTIYKSTVSGNSVSQSCTTSFCEVFGGGILNNGWLTILNSTVTGNSASISCSASQLLCQASGGGIINEKNMVINKSTISGNSAASTGFAGGGGIYQNFGTLSITNSTISGNTVSENGRGGGIYSANDPPASKLTVSNSTISGNGAGNLVGFLTIQNSIVAKSLSFGNCVSEVASNGYNLSSDNSCGFSGPGDMNNIDPKLGPLGNYGGPTQTIPLFSGSPAIDAGNPNGCTDGNGHLLTTDQRGKVRHDTEDTSGCDIGAFERQSD